MIRRLIRQGTGDEVSFFLSTGSYGVAKVGEGGRGGGGENEGPPPPPPPPVAKAWYRCGEASFALND
jgi:hypothetical protein